MKCVTKNLNDFSRSLLWFVYAWQRVSAASVTVIFGNGSRFIFRLLFLIPQGMKRHAVAQFVEALWYKGGRSLVRFPAVSYEFFMDIILDSTQPPTEMNKGKSVPLQAWSGPEGSRKLRFPDFMTTAQGGGKVSLTHRPHLPPGNSPGTHFC